MWYRKIIVLLMIAIASCVFVGCSQGDGVNQWSANEKTQGHQKVLNLDEENTAQTTGSATGSDHAKEGELIEEMGASKTVAQLEGRRGEFLRRLDNIQVELDALPEKVDSDAGVTNAMKNYYGRSYDRYDKELNEIYAILKEHLSPDVMEGLRTEQVAWIKHKEAEARKEESQYKGGSFEFVAGYISLYESTKDRCYELVNTYMTE